MKPRAAYFKAYDAARKDKKLAVQAARRIADPARVRAEVRRARLKHRFGITVEQYNELLAAQSGCCAICRDRPLERLCIDHNHETGKVRGLLCRPCNTGLGQFKDRSGLMRLAAEYVESR